MVGSRLGWFPVDGLKVMTGMRKVPDLAALTEPERGEAEGRGEGRPGGWGVEGSARSRRTYDMSGWVGGELRSWGGRRGVRLHGGQCDDGVLLPRHPCTARTCRTPLTPSCMHGYPPP